MDYDDQYLFDLQHNQELDSTQLRENLSHLY